MRSIRRILVLVILIGLAIDGGHQSTRAKSPSWQPGEHPRLVATAAEKSAIVSKLTTPGTASAAIWTKFLTDNFKNNAHNYGDGAFMYWITGNSSVGQQAVNLGQSWISGHPNGIDPGGASFNEDWYKYEDLLLIYDFAYDLLTPTQKTNWLKYIALQTAKCQAAGPGWAPGNINTLWIYCDYAGNELMEGENLAYPVTDEAIVRTTTAGEALHYMIGDSNIKISDHTGSATADYTEGVDYMYHFVPYCGSRCIDWSPAGPGTKEPATGATYYVSYTFTPDVVSWKTDARSAFEYHLNYQWHDGYYNGGLNPYGNLTTEQVVQMIEMIRRDTGIDYSQNQDIKRIVDMYAYSKLPSSNSGVPRRFNTINDTGGWTNYDADAWTYPAFSYPLYKAWLRPFIAWGTTEYANDSEGYGQRYLWLWAQAYRNADGTIKYTANPDWREALWINNAAVAPYLNTPAVPPAPWSNQRYFRGKEVVVAKTENWNTANINAAYMSLVAGNHNYLNEHDQGDAGSFTFFSHDEDWGIDPGYGDASTGAGLNVFDHNSVGLDGHGYDLTGPYGYGYPDSRFGAFAHFDDVVLTDGATAAIANLDHAWSLTSTPYLQRDRRYTALVNGSERSYMIVADDIQKDNANHSYQWYLHTGIGNTLTISGNRATITGVRQGANSARLDLITSSPSSHTLTESTSTAGNLGSHQMITDDAPASVNPYFLHLLIPSAFGQTSPTVNSTSVTGGLVNTVNWGDGRLDVILWRTTGSTITSGGITSDAKLTIVRRTGGVVEGFIVMAGRSLIVDGNPILSVIDGNNPVTVSAFGNTAGLYAIDASQIRIGLPFITAATLEDGGASIPVYHDGAMAYINGGQPLDTVRRNNGRFYDVNFDDHYTHDLFRFNLSHPPAENFAANTGALELLSGPYEWPSFSHRDSTPARRSALFPTMIPSDLFGDADISFRYKFNASLGSDAKFRVYLRTIDNNPADWLIDQNYVRLEFNAIQGGVVKNEVTVGQRVNGAWGTVEDNDNLTASLSSVPAILNDNAWHSVSVRLLGNTIRLTVDGNLLVNTTLPTAIPTAPSSGYIQWRVIGAAPVLLDDVAVTSIDQTAPVAPTDGNLTIFSDGSGSVVVTNGHGTSTDAQTLVLYESSSPILPSTDPTTLTTIASASTLTNLSISSADRTLYHAVGVTDAAGNRSQLLPLTADVTPPATIGDLQIQ